MLEHPLWRGDSCDRNDTLNSNGPQDDGSHTSTSSWSLARRQQPVINKSNKYQHKWWCRRKRRRLRRLAFAKSRRTQRRHLRITGTVCGAGRGQLQNTPAYLIDKQELLANEVKCLPAVSRSAVRPVASSREELYHTYKLDIKSDKLTRETSTPINVSSKSSSTTNTLSSLSSRTAAPTTTRSTPLWLSTIYSSKIFTPVLFLNTLLQSWLPATRKTARPTKSSLTPTVRRQLTNVVLNLLLITMIVPTTLALFVDSPVSIVAAARGGPNAASLALTAGESSPQSAAANGESSLGNLFMEKPGGAKAGGGSSSSFNLESKLAAVFRKAAYGTTTKRSIPDSVFVPSLTTVPTPLLTTFRYREKEKEINLDRADFESPSSNQQSPGNSPHYRSGNYESDLEKDHVLPTSAPNAEILKGNNNSNYPNPNRHHNHDRHRHVPNSTSSPMGHNQKKGNGVPTSPMYSGDMPSYSPPSRAFFTPPLPREMFNPFADKPTLRGTNSDGTVINTNSFINRRPIPPPSLVPGHERIPFRPPELGGPNGAGKPNDNEPHAGGSSLSTATNNNNNQEYQRKKALNTPSQQKINKMDVNAEENGRRLLDNANTSETPLNGILPFPSIERILSGSNERKGKIPDVLLRSVTIRPSIQQQPSSTNLYTPAAVPPASSAASSNGNGGQEGTNLNRVRDGVAGTVPEKDFVVLDDDEDDDDMDDPFDEGNPKTQPKTKKDSKPPTDSSQHHHDGIIYSTQNIPSLANVNNDRSLLTTTEVASHGSGHHNQKHLGPGGVGAAGTTSSSSSSSDLETWTIAWNIHVYLSAILFTILAVYSIFKMCFYDKLTHLFNQSYFVCIHLILILICLARIFYLCYDAYNIHALFHVFISEILLNLPATFLTVAFSCLILFLLIRSLNTKQNRYSALIRPLTVLVGSFVHVILCFTLHYVESYANAQQYTQYYGAGSNSRLNNNGGASGGRLSPTIHPPPRVLSLICQIIYIFVCTSLGLSYLYVYRMLKRSLRSKSQNYIHGYQNLSYAIHITIATALLFLLLAALQIYGAVSISVTARPMITSPLDIDWLQWGYQFSLRLIEVAIILLLLWVTGLKTGASKVLQREKGLETHNVSGFALFPCTSSSSQEHFETDYPAVCNANTNLHTYTLRTGKPIYDDNFALNSLNLDAASAGSGGQRNHIIQQQQAPPHPGADFQLIGGNSNEFTLACETNSMRSSQNSERPAKAGGMERSATIPNGPIDHDIEMDSDELNNSGVIPDHYENPNFELRGNDKHHHMGKMPGHGQRIGDEQLMNDLILDNCYSEPVNAQDGGVAYETSSIGGGSAQNYSRNPHGHHHHAVQQPQPGYDFQNFERPNFDRPQSRNEFRASKNLKAMKNNAAQQHPQFMTADHRNPVGPASQGGNYDSATLYGFGRNSIDRRLAGGVKKSGTLNSLAGSAGVMNGNGGNNSSSSSSSRQSGVKTMANVRGGPPHHHPDFTRGSYKRDRHRSSLERNSQLQLDGAGNPYEQNSGSSGDSATSGSMLVAEHGFVRFRALDDIGLNSSQRAAQIAGPKHAVTASRTSGRSSKEKRFTNS